MENHSRDAVRIFNATLVEAFWAGESIASIARRAGRSKSMIDKLISLDKQVNGPRERSAAPRDPRVVLEKKTISNLHGWIGLNLSQYQSKHNLSPTGVGLALGVSRVQANNMGLGSHDFTLTEIERIAKLINVSVEYLLNGGASIYQDRNAAA